MTHNLQKAFDSIQADAFLKERTYFYVQNRLRRSPARKRLIPTLALTCVFFCLLLGTHQFYYKTSNVISVDINPSIELSLNRFGRVIGQTAYNEDGQNIINTVNLRHKSYEEALSALLSSDALKPYLNSDAFLQVTLETEQPEKDEALLESIQSCVDQTLSTHHSEVTTDYSCTESGLHEEAHAHGLSIGKYQALQELLEADPNAALEDFEDKSMKEIKTHTQHCSSIQENSDGQNSSCEIEKKHQKQHH